MTSPSEFTRATSGHIPWPPSTPLPPHLSASTHFPPTPESISGVSAHERAPRSDADTFSMSGNRFSNAIRSVPPGFLPPPPTLLESPLILVPLGRNRAPSLPTEFIPYSAPPSLTPTVSRRVSIPAQASAVQHSPDQLVDEAISLLSRAKMTPLDLILKAYDRRNPACAQRLNALKGARSTKAEEILDLFMQDEYLSERVMTWFKPHAVKAASSVLEEEMDTLVGRTTKGQRGITSFLTPEFIDQWTGEISHEVPNTHALLTSLAQTKRAQAENTKKSPAPVVNTVVQQLVYSRSGNSLQNQTLLGMQLWVTGCQEQTINALHKFGLSVSYSAVLDALSYLSTQLLELAKKIAGKPHIMCYDNINISTSGYVSQRGRNDTPAKVQSGSVAILYPPLVRSGNYDAMRLTPIREHSAKAPHLEYGRDLSVGDAQVEVVAHQLTVQIVRILLEYVPQLKISTEEHATLLKHRARRPLPQGYKTEQYPLPAFTQEEGTTAGNLVLHDLIYDLLGIPKEERSEWVIITIDDQLTLQRNRSGQVLRSADLTPWDRREVFEMAFGLFHACQTLVWGLLQIHRGTIHQQGSLAWWFVLLDKTRLSNDKPDYYTLLHALTEILNGLILDAWRQEVNAELQTFAHQPRTAEEIYNHAQAILNDHAVPRPSRHIPKPPRKHRVAVASTPVPQGDSDSDAELAQSGSEPDEQNSGDENDSGVEVLPADSESDTESTAPPRQPDGPAYASDDILSQNLKLLVRDLLHLIELVRAVADGDIGRVEDLMPYLARIYRGTGSVNYCMEMLLFIWNTRHGWTSDFVDIMRDNMIVTFTGEHGHCMARDMNIEHQIKEIKALLRRRGSEKCWEQLGSITGSVEWIARIRKRVALSIGSYQKKGHTKVKTDKLVWKVAFEARTKKLQTLVYNRRGNDKAVLVKDVMAVGDEKMPDMIKKFNAKLEEMRGGLVVPLGLTDSILPPDFADPVDDEDEDEYDNGSVVS